MKIKHGIILMGIVQILALVIAYLAVRSAFHTWDQILGYDISPFAPHLGLWWRNHGLLTLVIPVLWTATVSYGYFRDWYPFTDERLVFFSGIALCLFLIFIGSFAFISIFGMSPPGPIQELGS